MSPRFARHLPSALLLVLAACSGDSTGPGGGGTTTLTPGTPVTIRGNAGSERFFVVNVPAGAGGLYVTMTAGSGDADLYIRQGARPTPDEFACGSDNFEGNETCFIPDAAAGPWYIAVVGFSAYNGWTLTARTEATPGGSVLVSGVPVTNISGAIGTNRYYRIDVPAGTAQLQVVTTGGTGDADLEVHEGPPTAFGAACTSAGGDSNESCTVSTPGAGTWWVVLTGYGAYSGVSLTATLTPSGIRE